jgi:DNA primase
MPPTAAANGKKRRRRRSSSASSWKPKKLTKAEKEIQKEKKEARKKTKAEEQARMPKVLEDIIVQLTTAKNLQNLCEDYANYDAIFANIVSLKKYVRRLVKKNASDDEDDATDSDDEDRNGDIADWTLEDAERVLDQLCIDRLKARNSEKNADLIEDRLKCLASDDADLLRLIKDMGGDDAMCMFRDYRLHAHLDLPYGFQVEMDN